MRRLEYLMMHDRVAFHEARGRWPFRYFTRVIDDPKQGPAWVSGVFNITLTMNRAHLRDCGTGYRAFVIDHEVAHMIGHHGFWAMLTIILCFPLFPFVRWLQEGIADRRGCRSLTREQGRAVLQKIGGNSWVHGCPDSRWQRAYACRR